MRWKGRRRQRRQDGEHETEGRRRQRRQEGEHETEGEETKETGRRA